MLQPWLRAELVLGDVQLAGEVHAEALQQRRSRCSDEASLDFPLQLVCLAERLVQRVQLGHERVHAQLSKLVLEAGSRRQSQSKSAGILL